MDEQSIEKWTVQPCYPLQWMEMREKYLQERGIEELTHATLQQIDSQFQLLCSEDICDLKFNKKHLNKNRYRDIMACKGSRIIDQHSRVNLDQFSDFYLNANQIKSLVDEQTFAIFSQAPLQPFDNFWQALYFRSIPLIVMLCPLLDPKRGRQADRYWPSLGKCVSLSKGQIVLKNQDIIYHNDELIETKIIAKGPQGQRTIRHVQWTGWSDLKAPLSHKLDTFLLIIDVCMQEIRDNHVIWIHCSAGVGRTGTLGAILEGIRLHEKQKGLSIFKIVENMRKNRFNAVQTIEQYHFLYAFFTKHLS